MEMDKFILSLHRLNLSAGLCTPLESGALCLRQSLLLCLLLSLQLFRIWTHRPFCITEVTI